MPNVEHDYLHRESTSAYPKESKVARHCKPVVLVKNNARSEDGGKPWQEIFTSFQSTGPTNIMCVNALDKVDRINRVKTRGTGDYQRQWVIEDNHARNLYLGTYSAVDRADHMIRNCQLKFRNEKWWINGALHFFGMFVVSAYHAYLECCEGELDPEWYVEPKDRLDFWYFRKKLSKQMITYHPSDLNYPGDESLRAHTQLSKKQRGKRKTNGTSGSDDELSLNLVTPLDESTGLRLKSKTQLVEALKYNDRLCKCLASQSKHQSFHMKEQFSMSRASKPQCAVCGKSCYLKCNLCEVYLHGPSAQHGYKNCYLDYHDVFFFGLARSDWEYKHRNSWQPPNPQMREANRSHILSLLIQDLPKEPSSNVTDNSSNEGEAEAEEAEVEEEDDDIYEKVDGGALATAEV